MALSDLQLQRYARHVVLGEVDEAGQEKLLAAKVLVVGAGGLGSPLVMYLAAAGVGTIGVVDDDLVDLSNLQRQILHTTARVGTAKVDSALETVRALNPEVRLIPHRLRLTEANAAEVIGQYDLVADGCDNFATRFVVNDTCYRLGKTLVSAAILRFDGQLATFKPHEGGPCYRCLNPAEPPPDDGLRCSQVGVFGATVGVMGSLAAVEVLKELIGIGESQAGWLTLYDGLNTEFRKIKLNRDPGCPLCGR